VRGCGCGVCAYLPLVCLCMGTGWVPVCQPRGRLHGVWHRVKDADLGVWIIGLCNKREDCGRAVLLFEWEETSCNNDADDDGKKKFPEKNFIVVRRFELQRITSEDRALRSMRLSLGHTLQWRRSAL
jgi:hypothetical protein